MKQVIAPQEELNRKRMERLPIIDPKNPSRKHTEKEEKWLKEMKTYEFYNQEEPGLLNKFTIGHSGNKMTFTFFHGGKYTVPRHIARHVESRATPIYDWRPNGQGGMIKEKVGEKSRFQMREVYE